MLIDSHCHLHDKEFFTAEEAEKCIARAHEAGVEKIVCIGTDPDDSMAAAEFAAAHPGVYWTYGTHPENSRQLEHGFLRDGSLAPVVTGLAPSFSVVTSESPRVAPVPDSRCATEQFLTNSLKAGLSHSTRVRCLSRATERPMVPTPEYKSNTLSVVMWFLISFKAIS